MKKIGIIGAGQLGLYLGLSAHKMGFQPIFLDSNDKSPASFITPNFICAEFDNEEKVKELVSMSDVVTYEFENVNLDVIKKLNTNNKIPQGHIPLEISNDRLIEKNTAKSLNIHTPKYFEVNSKEDLVKGIEIIGLPCILKTRRFGYDGKGQHHIKTLDDINSVVFDTPYILEQKLDFDFEISVIGIKSINNEIKIYEPIRNVHKDGILHLSYTQNNLDDNLANRAKSIVEKFMSEKNICGILCCELFVKDNQIYFNELAPRPHNSGHITMDTHETSQYENHIRAILGLPLGSVKIKKHGLMLNILGDNYSKINKFYGENTHIYDYKKVGTSPKRKMGHINFIGDDTKSFEQTVNNIFNGEF